MHRASHTRRRHTNKPARRFSFRPGTSACRNLVGWAPQAEYPWRSPLVVADYLAPLLHSNTSLLIASSHSADLASCLFRITASHPSPVALHDVSGPAACNLTMPAVDGKHHPMLVAYLRPSPICPLGTAERWVRVLVDATRGSPLRVLVGCDQHWPPDILQQQQLLRLYPAYARTEKLFFDEADVPEGLDPVPLEESRNIYVRPNDRKYACAHSRVCARAYTCICRGYIHGPFHVCRSPSPSPCSDASAHARTGTSPQASGAYGLSWTSASAPP